MDFEKFFSFLGKENTTTPDRLKAIMEEAIASSPSEVSKTSLFEENIGIDGVEKEFERGKQAYSEPTGTAFEPKLEEFAFTSQPSQSELSVIDTLLSEFDNPIPTYDEIKKLTLPEGFYEEAKPQEARPQEVKPQEVKPQEVFPTQEFGFGGVKEEELFGAFAPEEQEVKVGGEDLGELLKEFKVGEPSESKEVPIESLEEVFGVAKEEGPREEFAFGEFLGEGKKEEEFVWPSEEVGKEVKEEGFGFEGFVPEVGKGVEEELKFEESEVSFPGEEKAEEFIRGLESAESAEVFGEVPIESFTEEVSFEEAPKEEFHAEVPFVEEVGFPKEEVSEKVLEFETPEFKTQEFKTPEFEAKEVGPAEARYGEELSYEDYVRALEILKRYPSYIRKAIKDLIKNGLISENQVNNLFRYILSNPTSEELKSFVLSLAPFYRFEEVPERKVIVAAKRSKIDEFFEKAFKRTVIVGFALGVLAIVGIIVFNAVSRYVYSNNLYNRGLTLIDTGYYEEAENLFKRAEAVSGRNKYWYNTYAKRYLYNNAPEWAVRKLENALKYWPYDYETSLNYVDALLKLDPPDFNKALKYSQDFRRAVGNNFKGVDLNAQVYVKYGDYTKNPEYYGEAERLYLKFLQTKDNRHVSSLFRLISIYIRLDEKSKVDDIYNYIRAIDKKAIVEDVCVELARYYIDKDDLGRAKKVLLELSTINPKNPDFYYEFARYLYKMENFSESKRKLFEALKINPKHAKSYALLGDIALLSGKDGEAIENYQKSLSLNPDLVEPYYKLGDIFYNKDDFTTALGYYLSGFSKGEPEDKKYFSEVNYKVAKIYYMNGVLNEAVKYLSRSYVLDPYNPLISQFLGNIFLELKKPDLALVQFGKSVDVYSKILDSIKVINPKIVRHVEIVSLAARAYNNMGVSYIMMGMNEDNIKNAILRWEEARILAQNINTEYPIAKYNINLVMHPTMMKYSNFVIDKELPKSIPGALDYYMKQIR